MNRSADQSVKLSRLQSIISARKGLIGCGMGFSVSLHHSGRVLYTGADRWGQGDAREWTEISAVFCGGDCIVGLMHDGTLRRAGRGTSDARFEGLSHVRTVSCGATHMAALLDNGRVTVGGIGFVWPHDTAEWPAVTDVVCGADFTVGLTSAGSVVIAGGSRILRNRVGSWRNVAGIFTDFEGRTVYAITVDGRLLSSAHLPRFAEKWRNLVYVSAGNGRLWAVTAAGKLLSNDPHIRDLQDGGSFIACAVGDRHTLALTRDGRVLACGENDFGQCDTQRFGELFDSFENFSADRRLHAARREADARTYQIHYSEAARYRSRLACGERLTACITPDGPAVGRVVTSAGFGAAKQWSRVRTLACGNAHLLALLEDGTVRAEGNRVDGCCDVADWTNIKSVAAGKYHSLGLTEDGKVLFCGRNDRGQGDVADWTGICYIRAADGYTVGVTYDGEIRIAGTPPFDASAVNDQWRHPIDLVATPTHLVALYADGHVRSTVTAPTANGETWDTCGWQYVRAIAAGRGFTVGLCYGGRVVAVGRNDCGQCEVSDWKHMVAIGCGNSYTAGLTADGRVLTAGRQWISPTESTAPATDAWQNVMAIACGPEHLVAMNREGLVFACGRDEDRQCSATAHLSLFRDVRQLYGYGHYRKLSECGPMAPTEEPAEPPAVTDDAPQGSVSLAEFASFSARLREDAEALRARLAGSDTHLTVMAVNGTVAHYRYDDNELLTEAPEAIPVLRTVAASEATLLLYADGRVRVRVRDDFHENAPLGTLPGRLGDSPLYRVKSAAVGETHQAFLLEDGTARVFGKNGFGQGEIASWNHIVAVAAGAQHTVGLREDGTVVATGARRRETGGRTRGVAYFSYANPCAVEDWTGVTELVCAGDVTLGLCADGSVKAAGSNHYGQCRTDAWRNVVSVATSGKHTVALFADGHVEAVGLNESGECRVQTWRRVVQIAVLPKLTLGLTSDGRVLAAGWHHRVLTTLKSVRAIACFGESRQVFVRADGSISLHTRGSEYQPVTPEGLRLFDLFTEGTILSRRIPHVLTTAAARAARGSFAVGMAHTLYVGSQGTVVATGVNDDGQCDITAYGSAVLVAAGPYHSAALLPNGCMALSGRNPDGRCDARALNCELGTVIASAEESRLTAVPTVTDIDPAVLPYAWQSVACGANHTAALRTDGRVYAIGANPDGRCDTRQWRDVVDLACGVRHTVAVCADGTCVATGDNRYGQCDVAHLQGIIMVAAGEFHTVALRADGRVEAVGDNRRGQCRVDDLRGVISVACLPEATLCVHADGRVTIRGGDGELNRAVNSLREVVAISACEYRIGALTADRRLILLPSAAEAPAAAKPIA